MSCILIAIFMTSLQLAKYSKDQDSSSIQFKSFKAAELNNYPDISICFWIGENHAFNESKLPHNISSQNMARILEGRTEDLKNITIEEASEILLELAAEDDETTLEDLFTDMIDNTIGWYGTNISPYTSNTVIDIEDVYGKSNFTLGSQFFALSGTNSRFRCMTRKLSYSPGKVLSTELLVLRISAIRNYHFMKVHIHQPNQLIRRFGNMDGVGRAVKSMKPPSRYIKEKEVLQITIKEVKVLTMRHNSKVHCDKDLQDDDTKWMETVSKTLGCIPIH